MHTNQLINANDCAAILGIDRYRTRDDIMRKMVRAHFNKEQEFTENLATEYSTISKKTALYEYQIQNDKEVFTTGIHKKDDFIQCQPDGLIENGIIRIHCPFKLRDEKEPEFESIFPKRIDIYANIQMQLYCIDREFCDLIQWNQYVMDVKNIPINDKWIDANLPVIRDFYNNFSLEIKISLDYLEEKYLKPKIQEIQTKEAKKLLEEYDLLNIEEDSIKNRKRLIIEELSGLSDGRDLLVCGRRLTQIERAGSIRYAEIVKQNLPDIDLSRYQGEPIKFWKLT